MQVTNRKALIEKVIISTSQAIMTEIRGSIGQHQISILESISRLRKRE